MTTNFSECSIICSSFRFHVEDIFADPSTVITASVCMAVLTAFTLFANVAIILAMTLPKKNSPANTRTNNEIPRHLMTSLAACDLVWGGVGMTLGVAEVAENGRWFFGPKMCVFRLYVTYVWVSASVYHVNCLAVDRFLAICKPLLYRSLTNKTGYFMVAVSWIVPAALCIGTVGDVITGTETDTNASCFFTDAECMKRLKTFSYGLSIFLAFYGPFLCLYLLNTFLVIKVNFILKKRGRFLNRYATDNNNTSEQLRGPHCSCRNQTIETPKRRYGFHRRNSRDFVDDMKTGCHDVVKIFGHECKEDVELDSRNSGTYARQSDCTMNASESIDTNKPYGQVSGSGHPKAGQVSGNIRAYKTVGILVVCFTVCWCPALGIVCLYFNLLGGLPPHLTVVLWMSYINTAVNPFLYCLNRSVGQGVKRLLKGVYHFCHCSA